MYLIAEKENGQRFEMSLDSDINLLKFNDQSPTIEAYNETIEGLNRILILGNRVDKKITIELLIRNMPYREGLRIINRFFVDGEKIYLRHYLDVQFRFPVQVQKIDHEVFTKEAAKVNIEFLCETPTKESVDIFEYSTGNFTLFLDGSVFLDGSTDLSGGQRNPVIFDTDSDVLLDPRIYPFEIEFTGAGKNVTITNETTGDQFVIYKKMNPGDVLLITNTKIKVNGISVARETNKQLITMCPGENRIRVNNFIGTFTFKIRYRKQQY